MYNILFSRFSLYIDSFIDDIVEIKLKYSKSLKINVNDCLDRFCLYAILTIRENIYLAVLIELLFYTFLCLTKIIILELFRRMR